MTDKWYDKTAKQVADILKTDLAFGLDAATVKKRRNRTGKNEIYPTKRELFFGYLKHMLTDVNSLILLLTVAVAAVFDKSPAFKIMVALVFVYYIAAILTYVKAQNVLDEMKFSALPGCKVMRGGRLFMVKQEQPVRGDIIYLSAGDIVPCDARLVETDSFEVLEVNVTSVPHAVTKDENFVGEGDLSPARQKNMIFATSIVTHGTAMAIAVETGADTLVCKMGKNRPIVSDEHIGIIESLKKSCSRLTLAMTAAVLTIVVCDVILGRRGIVDSFLTGISLSVASMSEFYVAFAYIILAYGIFGAVKKFKDINRGALIKNAAKLEDMKDLSCLIVPKEGAFTVRDMCVEKVYANGDFYADGERGFERNARQTLIYSLIATGKYGGVRLVDNNKRKDNVYTPEEEAIISICEKYNLYNVDLERRYPLLDHVSLREDSLEVSLVGFENTYVAVVRGEFSSVLEKCKYYVEDSRIHEMTPEKRESLTISASVMSKQSYRVLAVASGNTSYNNLSKISSCLSDLTFEGFIVMSEPLLVGAAKNVSLCRAAGIKVIMLCDDESRNNMYLARSLGILKDGDESLTSHEMSMLKDGMYRTNIDKYTLYRGLNVGQKRLVLRYLKESGEKVGVLGSGLDDIILIKEADVGYAQSITISTKAGKAGIDLSGRNIPVYSKNSDKRGGSEALKFISDVIVSEADTKGTGGFNSVKDSILTAKVICRNIIRMMNYVMISQLARFFVVLFAVYSGVDLLSAVQILFCGLVIDFPAILIIAFEKPTNDLLSETDDVDGRMKSLLFSEPLVPLVSIVWAAATVFMPLLLANFGVISSEASANTCAFLSFVVTQMIVLAECKKEKSLFIPNLKFNLLHIMMIVLVASVVALSLIFPGFGALLQIERVPKYAAIGIAAVPVCVCLLFEVYKLVLSISSGAKKSKRGKGDDSDGQM